MCKEVFEMLCSMDRQNIELQIALQCAPTIAGLKTSNLLIINRKDESKVSYVLRCSRLLGYRLAYDRHRVIFLVFDRARLSEYLKKSDIVSFLLNYGYRTDSFGYILRRFQNRYSDYISGKTDFPHEIGVLLGYPLADVVGFIDNKGQNFLYSGYWKVYQDEKEKKSLFKVFDDRKEEMILMISEGITLKEIMDMYNDELPENEAV